MVVCTTALHYTALCVPLPLKLLFKAMICIATYLLQNKQTHTDEHYEHIAHTSHACIYTYIQTYVRSTHVLYAYLERQANTYVHY